jgi:transposase-like protein
MRASEFQKLLGELSKLDAGQRKAAIRLLSGVDEGRQAIEIVEAGRSSGRGCPHCGHEHVQPWGESNDLHRWRCKGCRRTFNALTGTPLAGLRKRELWLEHGRALVDGVSLRKVAARCHVALSTAFRWRHRHLKAPKAVQPAVLQGIVEADETYFLVSAKGSRKLVGRAARTRGGTASTPGLSDQHTAVLIARDRHGATLANVLFDRSEASLKPHLGAVLAKDCLLVSDGAKAYGALARSLDIGHVGHVGHVGLNASAGEYVKDGIYHIQNVNAWTSGLKAWMARFKGVASKNLPAYLGWRRMITADGHARTAEGYLMAAVA